MPTVVIVVENTLKAFALIPGQEAHSVLVCGVLIAAVVSMQLSFARRHMAVSELAGAILKANTWIDAHD
ncbi:hypothetical protein PSCICO_47470 [Pseudomonas cichorii]|uniref:hypothetical protein n=1 Tax=Pseudomonas cichorii TaxID=36746 RepID=UPI001910E8B9|nr:hypothetical protein [Pseudomonas cichorii]GFM89348.1 hypothetical protein PSCICO_47470 [Pseudomonas cichorii]